MFAVWLYEVLMQSQCVTFCRWRSAASLLGEGGEISAAEVSVVLLQTGSVEKCFLGTYRPKT